MINSRLIAQFKGAIHLVSLAKFRDAAGLQRAGGILAVKINFRWLAGEDRLRVQGEDLALHNTPEPHAIFC